MKKRGSWLSEYDLHLLAEGTHYHSYDRLGSHLTEQSGVRGAQFTVWAPNARRVSVVGDFNNWDESANPLESIDSSGLWTGFVPGVSAGTNYKYSVYSNYNGYTAMKIDPYAFHFETPPRSASVVWDLDDFGWDDAKWMAERGRRQAHDQPISIYEVHLGSWMRKPEEGNRWLSYDELADKLVPYVQQLGFTHVELLPITEHPFSGSWGYQSIGYFAATSRFGTPQGFMHLINRLHQAGIGVLMDWVPGHFPTDGHGLAFYDGTHLYEHADQRQGFHPDWGTYIFNFGRREVANFLTSSALFWIDKYHIDGLRVDAVASMLYLDYSREPGQWVPNAYGGRENIEAINFVKRLNEVVYARHPDVMMVAEESTAWPMVSRPTSVGGLGFGYKWNMGWMHDILSYFSKDPIYRGHHHNNLSFGLLYAYHENFMLPLSHDEVVHGKSSLISKMPGDAWQKFANLRLLFGLMTAYPGKKLLFMGGEFGQWNEWNSETSLDWHLLEFDTHRGLSRWMSDLNRMLREYRALYEVDFDPSGFTWVEVNDAANSVIAFMRYPRDRKNPILCVFNLTPVPRENYRMGVEEAGYWTEILNSDATCYAGSGMGMAGGVESEPVGSQGRPHSLRMTLPPLAAVFLRRKHDGR